MSESRHRRWAEGVGSIAKEVSRLAIACDIDIEKPGLAERILQNDESVCRRRNAAAFGKLRRLLMAFFPLKERMIDRLGPDDTLEILDAVRAEVIRLRALGTKG